MSVNLSQLVTEQRNPHTLHIDEVPTLEMVRMINQEDQAVALAVEKELPKIAEAVDLITARMEQGGRLIYCGAGTSGRLGVLDASECPPTYGVDPGRVIALIAGGEEALLHAIEGAEDSETLCAQELEELGFCEKDILVGIAASGRTPYAIGGMRYARSKGGAVLALTCNPGSEMAALADLAISPVVGPEAVTGSTRMKAGTAQKLVLNLLSTGTMIRQGKVYQNLMVDVQPTNLKLVERAKRIVMEASGCTYEEAARSLEEAGQNPKAAILMQLAGLSAEEASSRLQRCGGHIKRALDLGKESESCRTI